MIAIYFFAALAVVSIIGAIVTIVYRNTHKA